MLVYHGTTEKRARQICVEGFLPKKPSRRVWFADSRSYALGRARTQARRSRGRPVILTCEIDVPALRRRYGAKKVSFGNGVIAINGKVPVTVLRSYPGRVDQPRCPAELAAWVNHMLGLKSYKGVSKRHPGILRLSTWVANRMAARPNKDIKPTEFLDRARRCLPEYFDDYNIDSKTLMAYRRAETIMVEAGVAGVAPKQEAEALECLEDAKPERRIKGLDILAEIGDPELFDWCVMFLDDESVDVRVAALRTMIRAKDGDPEVTRPLTDHEEKRIRAAAISATAVHSEDPADWIKRGLRDPEPCVRVEAVALLHMLDPKINRMAFELATHDPNPQIARRARTLAHRRKAPRR